MGHVAKTPLARLKMEPELVGSVTGRTEDCGRVLIRDSLPSDRIGFSQQKQNPEFPDLYEGG